MRYIQHMTQAVGMPCCAWYKKLTHTKKKDTWHISCSYRVVVTGAKGGDGEFSCKEPYDRIGTERARMI